MPKKEPGTNREWREKLQTSTGHRTGDFPIHPGPSIEDFPAEWRMDAQEALAREQAGKKRNNHNNKPCPFVLRFIKAPGDNEKEAANGSIVKATGTHHPHTRSRRIKLHRLTTPSVLSPRTVESRQSDLISETLLKRQMEKNSTICGVVVLVIL